jgi:hypothetical protein
MTGLKHDDDPDKKEESFLPKIDKKFINNQSLPTAEDKDKKVEDENHFSKTSNTEND